MQLLMMTQAVDLDNPVLGFTHQWINELAQHFEHVNVLARLGGRTKLAQNVTLHAFSKPNQPDRPRQRHLFYHKTLAHLVGQKRVDTVFVHMIPKWVTFAYPYALLRRVPISLWYTHSAVNGRLRLANRLARHIFTASKESYRLPSPNLQVVGHGIDTEWFRPSEMPLEENGRFQIIMPGRITPAKQPHLLIEAIHQLPPPIQEKLCCHFIGTTANESDKSYEQTLHHQIKTKGLTQTIQFLGASPYEKMVSHYQNADLVVNLSQTNSLDKTVLEAMACGVPTLTSNPAFAPIFAPLYPQLTLQHGDVQNLTQQLAHWINNPKSCRLTVGTTLRQEVIEHHSLTTLIKQIAAALKGQ